ncbi:MAG: hypothetical protein BBJ57_11730 [Desulfobacterales bacterium PC51MH44]|nr:MAG: hypothetical protein BBJ57_11730 [Desulfobacterales bacterium PC51MH44]
MRLRFALIVIIIFMLGQGCSVYMAANQPDKKDVSVFNVGTPRTHVIAEAGRPLYTKEKADGTLTDTFVFVQGYSSGSKAGRALFHGAADVLTLGLWEVIGTPVEAVADGTEVKVQVEYDANEKVQNIIALSGGEELKGVDSKGAGKQVQQTAKIMEADESEEGPKLASVAKDAPVVRVGLRRQPILITNQMQITDMLVEYDFFDRSRNPRGSFVNSFIDNNDGTITDKATGLMWEKSGSTSRLNNRRAKEYIKQLNRKRFAGYGDWRMPTVEELASILVRKRKNSAHIDPVFDRKQTLCWTIDQCESQSWSWLNGAWLVDFKNGEVNEAYWKGEVPVQYTKNTENHVKAVRSVR